MRGDGFIFKRGRRWWIQYNVNGRRHREPCGKDVTTKDAAVEILTASMEHVRSTVGAMSDADLEASTTLYGRDVANWAVLFQLVAHMNEHLGQSIAYARSNGVVPPWSR